MNYLRNESVTEQRTQSRFRFNRFLICLLLNALGRVECGHIVSDYKIPDTVYMFLSVILRIDARVYVRVYVHTCL